MNAALKHYVENERFISDKEREITWALLEGLAGIKKVHIPDDEAMERLPVISFIIEGLSTGKKSRNIPLIIAKSLEKLPQAWTKDRGFSPKT
ncbi:hypothetical protein [Treponema primitia]|uniref:hypothetical protein n=1 Tax=Treponema primitia TaxID=88058 RepID=UPI00025554ED|nr:hypothetical protein [Treponema primitia]